MDVADARAGGHGGDQDRGFAEFVEQALQIDRLRHQGSITR
jgi:hypothetical protein